MRELSKFAERAYSVYLLGAVLLALLGYLWILLFPGLALALGIKISVAAWHAERSTDWLAIGALSVLLVLCGWITVDLLRMHPRLAGGQPLAHDRHVELWGKVDQLSTTFHAAPIDEIRIGNRFDVELEHTPLSGLPVVHTNTLILGLPLLQAVSVEHLAVLVARRLSLLPSMHNWPAGWLYHLRSTWHRYSKDFSGWSPGQLLMSAWFSWYAPLYVRFTLPLARRSELDADRYALRVFDAWHVEEAITTQALRKAFVENKLWPAIMRMSQKYPNPPLLPYSAMERLIEKELDHDRANRLLDGLLLAKPSPDSTMPTLKQRWFALAGHRPRVPVPARGSAARSYLKELLKPLQDSYDKAWLRTSLPRWKERHTRAQNDQQRLQRLLEQVPKELLSNEEIWECTVLVRQFMGQAKAVELYKALLATEPQDARVYFSIGSFLLSCRDAQGVRALETAMSMDESLTPDACELISEFMRFTGERRQARTYQRRAVEYSDHAA